MARSTATATASPKFVFANLTAAVGDEFGTPVILTRGDAWAADDPLVKHRPDCFDAEPSVDMLKRTFLPDGFDIFGDPVPA
jgi:hypothetical protein